MKAIRFQSYPVRCCRIFITLGLTAILTLLCSCSGPGFSSAYRQSVAEFGGTNPKPEVEGPWEGYWKSDVNDHTGKLLAIAEAAPGDGVDGGYDFRYHATWAKVLSGGYNSRHKVQRRQDGSYSVYGEKDIALIGKYVSEGVIDGDEFESTYRSSADSGVFILRRPE